VAGRTTRKKMRSAAEDARSAVKPAAESAIDKIGSVTSDAITAVASSVGPALDDARDRIGPLVEDARDRITPVVSDARDRITPALGDARDRLSPVVDSARDKIVPAAGMAVAAGRRRGRRAAVKLGLAEEPKKTHKLRNVIILIGLGGLAAFVYTKLSGKDADPAWTAGRDTAAADAAGSAPPVTAEAAGVDEGDATAQDGSGAAPTAPFASEETVESPVPTTPDEPLEEKQL
jgi:hypothetical protein